jgi:spermidine/putrescine-binding protein
MKRLLILIVALTLVVAACSSSSDDTTTTVASTGDTEAPTATEAPPATEAPADTVAPPEGAQAIADACTVGATDGDLNLYNWTEYLPYGSAAEDAEVTDLQVAFEEEYGVKVVITEYESNEAMLAQIDAGVPYDLIVPSDYMVSIMKDAGLLLKVNQAAVPNAANIAPLFTQSGYDEGNQFSMPYQWGTTGIGFSYDVIDDTDGVSWGVIFDPVLNADYAGFISLLDDERETMGAALKYLGYSLNSTNDDEIAAAAQLIADTKSALAAFASAGYEDLLVSGEILVSQGWNGDFFAAYDGASTDDYDAYEEFGYAIPIEGGAAWVDTMAIPATAEHPCTALTFMNFILDAENGGTLTNYNFYASPNLASEEEGFIWEEILADPAIYPPPEFLVDGTLEFFQDLGDYGTVYADAFAAAKS